MMPATFFRLLIVSMKRDAYSTAAIIARDVFGFFCTNSALVPRTFYGWSFQMSCVVIAVNPILSKIARLFHGSQTQNLSILPTRMFATICGGGTTIDLTSFSG